MSVILASGSPRRKELLEMLEVKDMKIIPAKGEECPVEGAGPEETVRALSRQKAAEVAATAQDGDIIIAADTIVWFNGRIFGKLLKFVPKSKKLNVRSKQFRKGRGKQFLWR